MKLTIRRMVVGSGVGGSVLAVGLVTPPQPVAAAADADAVTPTFTKDIAPIFQEKCEACHRPDSMAPMALQTYADVRPVVRAIRTRVAARQMPPWQIDHT